MKKIVFCLLLATIACAIGNAQKGGAAFFKSGYSYAPGASGIFNKIAFEGTPNFTNHYLIIGLEGYYRTGKYIFGWEGYSQEQPAFSLGSRSLVPYLGATHFKFGRVIKENRRSWLYPSVGAGAAIINLADYNLTRSKPDADINQMLITPSLDLAINQDILSGKIAEEDKKYGGVLFGIRAGYRASFAGDNWINGHWHKISNRPNYSNTSFYLSVSIGSGSFTRKK